MIQICLSWKRDSLLSRYVSESFNRIWVVEVLKSKNMNKYLESKTF